MCSTKCPFQEVSLHEVVHTKCHFHEVSFHEVSITKCPFHEVGITKWTSTKWAGPGVRCDGVIISSQFEKYYNYKTLRKDKFFHNKKRCGKLVLFKFKWARAIKRKKAWKVIKSKDGPYVKIVSQSVI